MRITLPEVTDFSVKYHRENKHNVVIQWGCDCGARRQSTIFVVGLELSDVVLTCVNCQKHWAIKFPTDECKRVLKEKKIRSFILNFEVPSIV